MNEAEIRYIPYLNDDRREKCRRAGTVELLQRAAAGPWKRYLHALFVEAAGQYSRSRSALPVVQDAPRVPPGLAQPFV